ncbi:MULTISPECIES: hypothetical protein [Paenibacillus]|uniref:hypothetical protein n=1 Tax=Paenibacillus TaxID=44249 RepID=UPI002000368E|nr:hypothetical protein [Paenibacillus pabuli]UPK44629.1 hypothetical protein KET34_03615 [Paenibacillus pabuli]
MIMKISYYTPDGFYYYVPDQYAEQIEEWRIEFSDFLQSIEGKHQFTQYTEYIDHEGKKEYGVFVRCYGGDEFADWINVEKLNCRGVYRIPAPPDDSEVGLRIDF